MNAPTLARLAFYGCATAVFLSGCGNPRTTIGSPSPLLRGREIAAHASSPAMPSQPWIRSWVEPQAKSKNLLYVTNMGRGTVSMYAYPSGKSAGTLAGLSQPAGLCTNAAGGVWIVESSASKLVRYAHGRKKPAATLSDSGASKLLGCAVDPTSNDLAVTDLGSSTNAGSVWIYANAQGTPKRYRDSKIAAFYFCGYDGGGNLFVDGVDANGNFRFAELPKGSGSLKNVMLDQTVYFPGGIGWDGQYVAVGDQAYQNGHASAILQVSVSGSTGTVEGTTVLASCDVLQFDISAKGSPKRKTQGNQIVAPDVCLNDAGYFAYPTGGNPTKTLNGLQYPVAAAVSLAPGK